MAGRGWMGVALAAGLALAAPLQARAETLADALVASYRTSGLLEQNRALLRAADEDVAVAVAAIRPVINYSLSSGYVVDTDSFGQTLTLTGSLALYDFGRNALAIDAAKESVLAARAQLIEVEQNVLLTGVGAYLDVREAVAVVNLRRSNLRLIGQQLQAARDRFEVGEVTRTDVSLAEARLASARSALASAEGDLAVARESYKASTGNYPGDLSPPPTPPQTAKTLDGAKAVARRTHPAIEARQHEVAVAELNILRARAAMKPTLNGSTRITTDLSGNDSTTLGLELSGPIYQGGRLSALYRQAQARRDAARAALLVSTQTVERNVGNAWALLDVSAATVEATARQIRAARVAFEGVQEEAKLGARTTLDVLDAEQELLDAQVTSIAAGIGRYRAVYQLLAQMGLLTVTHLGLGIATYDPAAYYNAVKPAPLREVSPQGQKLDRVLKSLGRF